MRIEENKDLSQLTTFGVKAKAKALAEFHSVGELASIVDHAHDNGMPLMVLGGGSNVLFTQDYSGMVALNRIAGITAKQSDGRVLVTAGAGVVWHDLVMHSVEQGWGGIENLSLIPGMVGAAPMQNIGAYGVELKDVFHSLEAYDLLEKKLVTFNPEQCEFGYRESYFKRAGKDRFVILSVTLELSENPKVNVSYGSIENELKLHDITEPSILDVSNAVIAIRQSKLPDPKEIGNAGSFFKNPVIPIEQFEKLKTEHPSVVAYPAPKGMKLAAGWLIEQAGWKGHRRSAIGVHDRQALVLVNHGGGQGSAILELSQDILDSVQAKFGVELEREVNIIPPK